MDQERIGNFIKSIRLENNLTQKEFADNLGVTYQAVSKWENGKNIPDISVLKQICDKYNINIDDILNGEKKELKKLNKIKIIIPFLLIIIIILIMIVFKDNTNSFEFKTISSKCSEFKIKGSAAYNKDKTSIYISSIEFCGKNEEEKYKEITCNFYENSNDTKRKISSCKTKKNTNIKDYLNDIDIKVDDYNLLCKKITSSTLTLEISAINSDNKTITYTIPIELNDNCK